EVALKLNPMNSIAKKNAARINALLHQKEGLKVGGTRVDLNLFVEEMGKTVITTIDLPSSAEISSKVAAGDVAELKIEGDGIIAREVEVVTEDEEEGERLVEEPASDEMEEGMHAVEDEAETIDFSDEAESDAEDEDEDEG